MSPVIQRFILSALLLFSGCFGCSLPAGAQTSRAALREGQKLVRNEQYVEAVELMNQVIRREPSVPELYYLRGYAKYSLDDYLGAELDYTRALELSPGMAEVLINRSGVRSLLMDFNGAYDDLARARQIDSTNIGIYISLAKLKLYLKKYYGCIGDCNTAIRLGCEEESPWILRGTAQWSLERYDEAAADFRKAMQINPSNSYPLIQYGSMFLDREMNDSAIVYFSRAVAQDSNNLYATFNRSLARIKLKDLEGAVADLNRVIRLSPYNSYAYFNRALVLYEQKQPGAAVKDLTAVIRLNPQHVTSYYYRGAIRLEMKDYAGALEDLDKAVSLYPENTDALMARSEVKLRLKDPAGSRADYIRAMELSAQDPLNPATLSEEKKSYLENIVKMTGDFEEMNTAGSKFQNQFIDISLREMYSVFTGKAPYERIRLYDTYGKAHYPWTIVSLTNQDGLATDSLLFAQIGEADYLIRTGRQLAASHLTRALANSTFQKYNLAFADYDTLLRADSSFVLAWFSRAVTRYGLIRLIRSLDDYGDQITIGRSNSGLRDQVVAEQPEHNLGQVIRDLTEAIHLDTGFYFAYYNRGFVYAAMGEYAKAAEDFTTVLSIRENFADALYNRGLLRIMMQETDRGCEDLSRAGELGIPDAYRVIKRYCYK